MLLLDEATPSSNEDEWMLILSNTMSVADARLFGNLVDVLVVEVVDPIVIRLSPDARFGRKEHDMHIVLQKMFQSLRIPS